jgi:HAMP domain-containing protein
MDLNPEAPPKVLVERSTFEEELTAEEMNILAILMMEAWVQRQVTSIENTRMKYSGTDFKMTSQANHLAKLQSLLKECQRQSHHMQRLYKRR